MDERLRKMLGKAKEFTHEPTGTVIELAPFKGKDLDLLLGMGENPSKDEIVSLVVEALVNSGIEVTKEEVLEEFTMDVITWIATCVGEVNGTSN